MNKKRIARAGYDYYDDTPENIRPVVHTRKHPRPPNEERERPKDGAQLLVVRPDNHGNRSREEHVIGGKAVVGGMDEERREVADDERARVVIEQGRDARDDVGERSNNNATDRHALHDLLFTGEEIDGADEDDDYIEILRREKREVG